MRAAYYGLHYGKEWLNWSMRSVREHVDEIHVFYASKPSHGTQTSLRCPETKGELKSIADYYQAIWWDCPHFHWEGEHRDYAVNALKQRGADTILVVDGDEVWEPNHLEYALDVAKRDNITTNRVFMRHFWRSLKWVCDDEAAPVRIIMPNVTNKAESYIGEGKVFHMGYAQSPSIIEYKQQIHGHRAEWREGWFDDIFIDWMPGDGDVHPTNIDFWTPHKYYDESDVLKQLVGDHPYWGLDIIE